MSPAKLAKREVLASLIAAGIGLAGYVAVHAMTWTSNAKYSRALVGARKSGLPVTTAELATTAPPASENAATAYARMTALLNTQPISQEDMSLEKYSRLAHPTIAQTHQIKSSLARRSDLLQLAHQAASRPNCVFATDWKNPNPAAIIFPDLKTVREAARIISSESVLMAREGHGMQAVQNEALCFRIAQHAGSDGLPVQGIVQDAVNAIALRSMQYILLANPRDTEVAKAVMVSIDKNWKPAQVPSILRRETAMQTGYIEYLRQAGPFGLLLIYDKDKPAAKMPDYEKQNWNTTLNENGMFMLSEMSKMTAASELPYPQAIAEEIAISASRDNSTPQSDPSPLDHFIVYGDTRKRLNRTIGYMTLPVVSRPLRNAATDTARARVTHTAAAILNYKVIHGSLPTTLETIGAPIPVDPFDQQPLRYRREGNGFVVYSVGTTLHYDGGTAGQPIAKTESAFRYPAAT